MDEWAARNGFHLPDLGVAKAVSAAILEGNVPLKSDFPIAGDLPPGMMYDEGEIGIYVAYTTGEPFRTTLRLLPPTCAWASDAGMAYLSKEAFQAVVGERPLRKRRRSPCREIRGFHRPESQGDRLSELLQRSKAPSYVLFFLGVERGAGRCFLIRICQIRHRHGLRLRVRRAHGGLAGLSSTS